MLTAMDAKRRRERRLRQFLRHELLSVAMALAAAQHHSVPKSAGFELYEAQRGHPGAPWVEAVTVVTWLPLLVVPTLHGEARPCTCAGP